MRTFARELPNFRSREKGIINPLKEEGRSANREVVRECGAAASFVPPKGGSSRNRGKWRNLGERGKSQEKKRKWYWETPKGMAAQLRLGPWQ